MPTEPQLIMVREALPDDAARVAVLLTQLGAPGVDEAEAGRRLARGDERVLVAVDEEGVVTGLVAVKPELPFGHAEPLLRITALVSDADRRRRGAAKALIDSAKQLAGRLGCTGIELTCGLTPDRAAAHRFYPEQGFVITSHRYWWAGEPAEEVAAS
ncbi:GNAT family N-acetyltransferase [Microlunatus sp. GCM10028923]|uniref:GNAT family N-acetyltransferase n=1 Tax=Microlunatus sp. GCM10028923 TaxID=3273400 RepID=UPI003614DDD7